MLNELSHSELTSVLNYDPETGVFTWAKTMSNRAQSGKQAGSKHASGRTYIAVGNNRYLAHRLAWMYVNGAFPKECIDHINGDNSDNRICNLREASHAENMQNHRKARSDSAAGLAGVSKAKGKRKGWHSEIKTNGKKTYIGYFKTKELAHEAYLVEKRKQHPFCTI